MKFEMPSVEEWAAIEEANWSASIEVTDNDFDFLIQPENSPSRMAAWFARFSWRVDLQNRIYHTRWSYVILLFLYDKGIPDQEWVISPGKDGYSTEYFPHFEHDDHIRKAQFNYFADVFYFKLYSALDTIGHLLNTVYGLGVKKVDFHRAAAVLKDERPELHDKLQSIINSNEFQEMRAFRVGSVHNEPLGSVGEMANLVSEHHSTFGSGSYITSTQIKVNAQISVRLLEQILSAIREQIELDKDKSG